VKFFLLRLLKSSWTALRDAYLTFRVADNWKSSQEADVVIIAPTHAYHDETEEGRFSSLLDPLHKWLLSRGLDSQKVLLPIAERRNLKLVFPGLVINRVMFLARVRDHLGRVSSREYGGKTFQVAAYRRILQNLKPRLVLVTNAPEALCIAAHQLAIPIVEVHHGFGTSFVPWGWNEREANELPNGFLAFDGQSCATFSALESKGLRVSRVPFPYLFVRENAVVDRQLLVPQDVIVPDDQPVVLVSLQWGYGGEKFGFPALPNGLVPEALLEAVQSSAETAHWLFRFHPVLTGKRRFHKRIRSFVELLSDFPNCQWEVPTRIPLWEVMDASTCHITMSSSTTAVASAYGRRSLVLDPRLKPGNELQEMFREEQRLGDITLGDGYSAISILEWIHQQSPLRDRISPLGRGSWVSWLRSVGLE